MNHLRHQLAAAALGAVALLGALVTSGAASASIAHDRVATADPVNNTPHVQPDTAVPKPRVDAITTRGDTVYMGGRFNLVANATRTDTVPRSNLVAFDANTGAIASWSPQFNGPVLALAATSDALYVGGDFSAVDGISRRGLVKIDTATGAVDAQFNANFSGGKVNDLEVVDGRLFVAGTATKKLMALDLDSGIDTNYVNLNIRGKIDGSWGTTSVHRFAVNPAGTQIAAVGNFLTVSGQIRHRAFVANLGGSSAILDAWYYNPLTRPCASTTSQRQAYLTDVDYSPDGEYFVVVSTGSTYRLATDRNVTICDAVARFDVVQKNPDLPVWINYTGGDTIWSVAATGAAVYVQGHFQYLNNPDGNNSAGPGAVSRKGVGAVDPRTGAALSWNPGAPASIGGKAIHATPNGLWFGSDSIRFKGEYHRGIAYTPLM